MLLPPETTGVLIRFAAPVVAFWLLMLSGDVGSDVGVELSRSGSNPNSLDAAPVPDILDRLLRDFDLYGGEFAAGHRGVDVETWPGETIRSPITGWVHFAGYVVNRPITSVLSPQGELYAFEPACSLFEPGQSIERGEALAEVCPGGEDYSHCEQTCLHISLRVAGHYLSPLSALGLLEPSRLYPLSRLATLD